MDENPKGLKALNSPYFFTFTGFNLFLSSTISAPILPFFFQFLQCDGWLFTDQLYLPFLFWGQYQKCSSSNDKPNPNYRATTQSNPNERICMISDLGKYIYYTVSSKKSSDSLLPITRRAQFGHNIMVISNFLCDPTNLFTSQPNIGLRYQSDTSHGGGRYNLIESYQSRLRF